VVAEPVARPPAGRARAVILIQGDTQPVGDRILELDWAEVQSENRQGDDIQPVAGVGGGEGGDADLVPGRGCFGVAESLEVQIHL
jgi:hypothetical protein